MSDPSQFQPPGPEEVGRYLLRHAPRQPTRLQAWSPQLSLLGVMLLAIVFNQTVLMILPWLAVAGLVIYSAVRAARNRRVEQQTAQAHELAMLRHHAQSFQLAWRTLPEVTLQPELNARLTAILALNLQQVKSHEAAIVACNFLLKRLPEDHPSALQLRVQRAVAELAADHLVDADRSLRSLRELAQGASGGVLAGMYHFALLFQMARTLRDEDALALAPNLMEVLKPLGVEAGQGYALLALAYYRLAQRRPLEAEALLEEGGKWWARATCLQSPAQLADRLPETAPLQADPAMQKMLSSNLPPPLRNQA